MKTDNFVSFVHCPFPVPKLELVQYVFYELICLKNAVLYGRITSFLSSDSFLALHALLDGSMVRGEQGRHELVTIAEN